MRYSYFYVFPLHKYVGKADVVMTESVLMEFADGSSNVEDYTGRILFLFYQILNLVDQRIILGVGNSDGDLFLRHFNFKVHNILAFNFPIGFDLIFEESSISAGELFLKAVPDDSFFLILLNRVKLLTEHGRCKTSINTYKVNY